MRLCDPAGISITISKKGGELGRITDCTIYSVTCTCGVGYAELYATVVSDCVYNHMYAIHRVNESTANLFFVWAQHTTDVVRCPSARYVQKSSLSTERVHEAVRQLSEIADKKFARILSQKMRARRLPGSGGQ